MTNYTSRFATLLGECRRQMNGAVVGSMRYFGADYGLNYGVSLPTLRELAKQEGQDYQYAKYLYQQQVREIRLISFWVAESKQITTAELPFWAEGIINTEVAEEASFALFYDVDAVTEWLDSDSVLLVYTALLSISKGRRVSIAAIVDTIIALTARDEHILAKGVVSLLDNYYRNCIESQGAIIDLLKHLPANKSSEYIIDEMSWRTECCD